MDNFYYYFLSPFLLSLVIFLWLLKRKTGKTIKEIKTFNNFTILELLQALYMLVYQTPPTADGQKMSRSLSFAMKFNNSNHSGKKIICCDIFGTQVFIALDYETIYQINTNDEFYGRGPEETLELYHGGKPRGIIMNNDEKGRILKTFVMKKFGALGMKNKERINFILTEQLSVFLSGIEKLKIGDKTKFQVVGLFSNGVYNVLANFIFGKKLSANNPDFINAHKTFTKFVNFSLFNIMFLHVFKKLRVIRELFGYTHLRNVRIALQNILRSFHEERSTLKMQMRIYEPENTIDFFLLEIEKQKENKELNSIFCVEQLTAVLQDLAVAGLDTSTKFLECFLMYMCLYPDVQVKVQKEIDSILGSSTPCYYYAKSRMNYTMATFAEVHRLCSVLPIILRFASRDSEIAGHRIKKGSVIINAYLLARLEENYWKKPFAFYPENFLDDNGVIWQEKVNHLLLFGNGSRKCPAEQIGNAMTFTFGVGILQKYTVKKYKESDVLGAMIPTCLIIGPEPFHVKFVDR